MDRPYDLTPEHDSIGFELPFNEAQVSASVSGELATDLFDESPFAERLLDEWEENGSPISDREAFGDPEFEQETGTSHQFKELRQAERKLLITSADRAVRSVRHAAAFVGSAHGNPKRMSPATRQLLLTHFHTVRQRDLRVILTRLQRIAKAFDEGIKFVSRRQCDASAGRMTCGYAYNSQWFGGFGRVQICFDARPGHCNFPALAGNSQDALVIHEVAHRYVGIDDKAYYRTNDYPGLSADAAMDNADSYAYFAVEAIGALSEAEGEQSSEWSNEQFEWTGEEFDWRGERQGGAEPGNFEQDQATVDRLLQAGDWRGAIKAAIADGERDEGKLTNLIFFFRHPELDRTRPLQPKTSKTDAALAKEWLEISRKDVWPAIVEVAKNSALAVDGQQIASRIVFFRGKTGKRFKELVSAAAQKVDLNPGVIAAALIGEIGTTADYLSRQPVRSYRIGVDDFFELRGVLAQNVPAYADIRWDKKQKPQEHKNDAMKNQRIVKTIWFDSGPDGLLATAVYLKYAEVRLRSDAAALGGEFDKLPVETRFALIRMSMAAGRAGARERLARALKGEDILVRNWAPPKIYHTGRNATIRAAEAMFLSSWIFGQSLSSTSPTGNVSAAAPQLEQFESDERERPRGQLPEGLPFRPDQEGEELAWLDLESGGPGQFFEEEGSLADRSAISEGYDLFEPEEFADGGEAFEADENYAEEALDAQRTRLALPIRAEELIVGGDDSKCLAPLFAAGTLRRGAFGLAVRALQYGLQRLGWTTVIQDSQFGPETYRAVCQFQSTENLLADGAVGPQTKAAIALTIGAKKAKAKSAPSGQLDLAGFFVWDPAISAADEKAALAAGQWHPATIDFLAVMGSSVLQGMGDFVAILGEIVKRPVGTVKRVNFMTHANNKMIGIRGRNDVSNVWFDVAVTDQDITNLGAPGLSFTAGTTKFTLQDVRDRFAEGAVFVLYGCHAGLNISVLQALNKLLGIKVVSFKKEIVFCPPGQGGPDFNRKGMKIGINKSGFACSADSTTDWLGLINHPDAVSVP